MLNYHDWIDESDRFVRSEFILCPALVKPHVFIPAEVENFQITTGQNLIRIKLRLLVN